ncbi:MAG TPA: DNRLRE domain-containing protein [Candidatus Paceibacterota bacterium]|nr:DNRLRE domain-containing protein [Candidatus Paceibacterota bacterium]
MSKRVIKTAVFGALVAAAVFTMLTGCGSAGAGGGTTTNKATLGFDEGRSGWILLNSGGGRTVYSTDDSASNHTYEISAGDGVFGQVDRGFMSFGFDFAQAPSEIVSASLHVYVNRYANDPYAALGGQLEVYGVDYGDLDGNDYYTSLGEGAFVLSTSTDNEDNWISVEVTAAVKNDWSNGESRTQFIFRFPDNNNGDSNPDRIFMNADESDTKAPYLTVEYR